MKDRIKQLRRVLGLTQREFAEKIGVKQNTVATYEMGRSEPFDSVITLICREYNVSEEWLRNGTGEMFNPEPKDELDALAKRYNLNGPLLELIKKIVNLDDREREILVPLLIDRSNAIAKEDIEVELPGSPESVSAAEAAYEKSLGIAPKPEQSASNTTGDTEEAI